MSILLTILLVLILLIVLLFIAAAFMKDEYVIERSIIINRPSLPVFDYIKYLKHAGNYNKWEMMDPNLKKAYTGIDGTVGFISSWDSENKQAGKGQQEITRIKEGERVDYEIRFEKPFKGTSQAWLTVDPIAGNQTKVSWALNSTLKYPMKVLYLVFNLKKTLGNDISTSLGHLKNIMEK